MSFLDSIFNPIILPLLQLPPVVSIAIISLVISLIITYIYKWMTDQKLMKSLKDDIKKYQKEMKGQRDNPKKMMETQKKAMDVNMKYMMHSMKPTLVTFIPIILIFAYLNGHIDFHNINPAEEFTTSLQFAEGASGNVTIEIPDKITLLSDKTLAIKNNSVTWKLKGEEGKYPIKYIFKDESYTKDIVITAQNGIYENPVEFIQNSKLTTITTNNRVVHPFGETFNIFGWYPGWIACYIVFSLIFSMGLRKILNLY